MRSWVLPLLRGWPGWYHYAPYPVRRLRRDVLGTRTLLAWLVKTTWQARLVRDVPLICSVAWEYRGEFYPPCWRD